jgi:dipeptidyl aminopeptidase/acylaminoacyl peptidase
MESGVQKQYPGLYCYDIPTGETRCYIPDGQQKVEVAQLWDDGAVITTTNGSQYGSCQMPEFFHLNLETGEMELLCLYQFSVGAAITTDSTLGSGITHKVAGDFLYFITLENGCSYLRRLGRNGILSENLTPDGSCASFDIWKEHVAYLGMYGNGLRELYLDGKQITFFNDPLLQDYSISSPIPLESQRPGGETVQGWVIPPAEYQKGKKYPAILNIHGGPHAAFGATFFHEMQVWANAGYFVFYCNPHGSDGRGNAFGDMRGIYGSIDYEDIMAFTDAVLAAWPDIDASRLGVTGGSYGGYMTNWIIGHTNRFRCAASQRSISDWAISEMVSDCGYQRNAAKMGASALEDHEKVWFHSPLKYAGNVTTPTLFLHSYEDYRCHHTQAIAMYTAIRQRGVESRLCIFKGENHELSRSGKPKNRISRMTEILTWMDRHLKN